MVDVIADKRDRPTTGWAVLFSPRRAFLGQSHKPAPLLPMLIVAAFALVPPICFVLTVDMQDFLYSQMRAGGQIPSEMPDEARAILEDKVVPAMKAALPVGAVVQRLGWILALALIAWGILRGTRKELRFKAVLGSLTLASVPLVIHDLLTGLVFVTRDIHQFDPKNPVLSNPAAWFRLDIESSALGAAAHAFDLFGLWTVLLCGLALSVVAKRRGLAPYLLPIAGFALILVGHVAAGAAGAAASSFSG